MSEDKYNWWTDPKNAEEVARISWWEKEENKEFVKIPISVVQADEKCWVASFTEDDNFFGDMVSGCAQGETKEEAISQMFKLIRFSLEHSEDCSRNYARFVPLKSGSWKGIGSKWFSFFGHHVYFRAGKGMKGGWYIPFTKLNILYHSEWVTYKSWKESRKEKI